MSETVNSTYNLYDFVVASGFCCIYCKQIAPLKLEGNDGFWNFTKYNCLNCNEQFVLGYNNMGSKFYTFSCKEFVIEYFTPINGIKLLSFSKSNNGLRYVGIDGHLKIIMTYPKLINLHKSELIYNRIKTIINFM